MNLRHRPVLPSLIQAIAQSIKFINNRNSGRTPAEWAALGVITAALAPAPAVRAASIAGGSAPVAEITTLYRPDQFPADHIPPDFAADVAASHRLQSSQQPVQGSLPEGCSTTAISSDGYMITALHCFEHCILDNNTPDSESNAPWHKDMAGLEVADYSALQGTHKKCWASIDQNPLVEVDLVATGRGLMRLTGDGPYRAETLARYRELELEGYDMGGDFAIFKLPDTRNAPCAKSSFVEPTVGEAMISLGFPVQTRRPGPFNSDGNSIYATYGKRTAGVAENTDLPSLLRSGTPLSQLQRIWDIPGLTSSTLDLNHANSGGGAFRSSDGRLVGVMNTLFTGRDLRLGEVPGSAYDTSLSQVRQVMLRAGQSAAEINQIFNCAR